MDTNEYKRMDELEKTHWWYVGRRNIVKVIFHKYVKNSEEGSFLDVGCGTGEGKYIVGNVGKLTGLDNSKVALAFAEGKGYDELHDSSAENLPFADNLFQGIITLDVLEHVLNDTAALLEYFRVLELSGLLFITVPAYMWLWSGHDEAFGHKRRYSKKELVEKIKKAGFEIVYVSYYVTFFFFIIATYRLIEKKLRNKRESHFFKISKIINKFLLYISNSEALFLKYGLTFPFGSSLIVVARKPNKNII